MKPLTACAALALAVHAGLLWLPGRLHARSGNGTERPMQVRLAAAKPDAVATAPSDEGTVPAQVEPDKSAERAGPATDTKADDETSVDAPDRFAPLLDADESPIRMPDAQMPEHGADLRAYVRLNEQGRVETVSVTSATTDLPIAFNNVVEVGLRQSHLRAAQDPDAPPSSGLAYCLSVRFESDQLAPQLRWLPGAAASPGQCLGGKPMSAAQDIERR